MGSCQNSKGTERPYYYDNPFGVEPIEVPDYQMDWTQTAEDVKWMFEHVLNADNAISFY